MCILVQSVLDCHYYRKKRGKCMSLISCSSFIDVSILVSNVWMLFIQDYVYLEFD